MHLMAKNFRALNNFKVEELAKSQCDQIILRLTVGVFID